jgi:hypothetical protein
VNAWTRHAAEQLILALAAQASRPRQRQLLERVQTTVTALPQQFPATSAVKGVAAAPVPETSYVILYRLSAHALTILGIIDPTHADT